MRRSSGGSLAARRCLALQLLLLLACVQRAGGFSTYPGSCDGCVPCRAKKVPTRRAACVWRLVVRKHALTLAWAAGPSGGTELPLPGRAAPR